MVLDTKICTFCNVRKSRGDFYKRNPSKTWITAYCKICTNKKRDEYRQNKREKAKAYTRKWRKDNPKYENIRYKKEINFKLKKNLRSRLNDALKWNYKSGSAVKDLGLSIAEFKLFIEKKFYDRTDKTKMVWDNYGEWHLDHIIPLCSFNLSNRSEFLKACNWSNYQPLWKEDNYKKGKRYDLLPR